MNSRTITVSILMAWAMILATATTSAAPVYLKADATGACDGTSWQDAWTHVTDAVTNAIAGDGVLYVAQGVYTFDERFTVSSDLAIYGGFEGASMAETPETRNTAAHPTVFSGDVGGDDYWTHYETNTSFSVSTQNLTQNFVVGPSGVNMPPDFTGDYDGYRPNIRGTNIKGAFLFTTASTAIIDGLTFTGFYPTDSASATAFGAVLSLQKSTCVVNDCTFIGNSVSYGAIYFRAKGTVTNCRFLYNWANARASALTVHAGAVATVSNCTFLCCSRTSTLNANVFNGWGGGFRVRNCSVVRCLSTATPTSWGAGNYGGCANIWASEGGSFSSFTDCVVSNCYTAFWDNDSRYTPQFTGNVASTRTLFANNLTRVKPTAGKCYAMFGSLTSSEKNNSFDACTFSGNVIDAAATFATSGSYVLAIIGNFTSRCDASLLNCSFEGNAATAVEAEGLTPILCRGVATAAYAAGAPVEAGLANCAFKGPADGTYAVVQYGTGHSKALNIVNCVFTAEGEERADPIYADVPGLVNLYSCSIQNKASTSDGPNYDGLETDKVPLAHVQTAGSPRFALAAAARTPAIRESCDVATNSVTADAIASWNFCVPGGSWQALAPSTATLSGGGFPSKLVGDALGAPRSEGSFTRGPVQTLAGEAEAGATLVLRRDPFTGGSFSDEAVQAVAAGSAPAPVTITLANPANTSFAGWFDENGDLYSSSASLTIPSLAAGTTILTAKIETPKVTITFSLGGCGIFNDTRTDISTVMTNVAVAFPDVPAFTMDPDWHFLGFDLPDTVPPTNATYVAKSVSKAVRIIHVVPPAEAPANPDGLSWATAYGDIGAAYADAGLYRGEVWIKGGTYLLPETLNILPNVAVRGGFSGVETSAGEADPEANPTVISGDVSDNDYWKTSDGVGSLAANKIWQDGVFQPPNPDGASAYWAATGNSSDNTSSAFVNTEGAATNCVFSGLVFTGFRQDVVIVTGGQADGILFDRCKFLACMTSGVLDEQYAVIRLYNVGASFTNCVFDGNTRCIWLDGSSGHVTTFSGCAFSNSYSGSFGGAIYARNSGYAHIDNCRFFRNYCSARGYQGAAAVAFKGTASSTWQNRITDTVFEENRPWSDCHGTVVVSSSTAEIERCRFVRNSIRYAKFVSESGNGACISTYISGSANVRDCHFAGNSASDSSGNTIGCSSVLGQQSGSIIFANCTIEGSTVTNNSTARLSTISHVGGNLAIIHCLIDGSLFSGDKTCEVLSTVNSASTFSIVNTAIRSEVPGYKPFIFTDGTFVPAIANSVITGYDPADMPALGSNGFLYDVVAGTPTISGLREKEGVAARAVKGAAYARFGRPVWLVGTTPYIYDPLNGQKPWRSLLSRSTSYVSVAGLSLDSDPIPDAFGEARTARKIAVGPLNAAELGTTIIMQ